MKSQQLFANLMEMAPEVPDSVPVFAVQKPNLDQLHRSTDDLLRGIDEVSDLRGKRNRWVEGNGRSVLQLSEGARASVYHQSGAIVYKSGLNPGAQQFKTSNDVDKNRAVAEKSVASVASRLPLDRWVEGAGHLVPERVWRIMGAGADNEGQYAKPIMFRAVGAYRLVLDDIPVWGPASVALKVTGDGNVDSVSTLVRRPEREPLDKVPVLQPEVGLSSIVAQLEMLMGGSTAHLDEVAKPHWVRFGYLAGGKRKAQRTLEPVYVTQIDINGEDAQGYLLAASAGERVYEPVCRVGQLGPAVHDRQLVANR